MYFLGGGLFIYKILCSKCGNVTTVIGKEGFLEIQRDSCVTKNFTECLMCGHRATSKYLRKPTPEELKSIQVITDKKQLQEMQQQNKLLEEQQKALQATQEPQPIRCPKCNSTQIAATSKGFSVGKAVAGTIVAGGVGALAGFAGNGKVKITCLNCGLEWTPGK